MAVERTCAWCRQPMPAGTSKHASLCSPVCRSASFKAGAAARRAAGVSWSGPSWPVEIETLLANLAALEIELSGAAGPERERLALEIKRLADQIEVAKSMAMLAEAAA